MLFEKFTRTNVEPYKRSQTAYEFLNVSAWDISKFSRKKLNEIVENYPIDEEFIKMLKSKSNKQHHSSVFELLVYTTLINSHLEIEKHPQTKNGKRPDFKIKNLKNSPIFLECTLSGNNFENADEKNRKDVIEEIIDSIEYFPYWINLEFVENSKKNVSKKKLIRFVNQIKTYSDDHSNNDLEKFNFEFSDNDWIINISLFRKSNTNIKRSLGMINYGAKVINKTKAIITALNDKRASKYKISDEPYVICISTNDFSISKEDISEILFGQFDSEKLNLFNTNNSFWIANSRPINTGVSAIIFYKNFDLFTLESSQIEMWHNPFAKNKIDVKIFPYMQYFYESTENGFFIKKQLSGENIFSVLNINELEYSKIEKN